MRYTKRTVGVYSWDIVASVDPFPKFDDRAKIVSDLCYRLFLDLDVGKVGKEVILNEDTAGSYILVYIEVLTVKRTSNLYLYIDIIIYNYNIILFEWFVFPDNILLFEYRNNWRD